MNIEETQGVPEKTKEKKVKKNRKTGPKSAEKKVKKPCSSCERLKAHIASIREKNKAHEQERREKIKHAESQWREKIRNVNSEVRRKEKERRSSMLNMRRVTKDEFTPPPDAPNTAYILFVIDKVKANGETEALKELSPTHELARYAKMWKLLSDEEKGSYIKKYKEARAVYKEAHKKWKESDPLNAEVYTLYKKQQSLLTQRRRVRKLEPKVEKEDGEEEEE